MQDIKLRSPKNGSQSRNPREYLPDFSSLGNQIRRPRSGVGDQLQPDHITVISMDPVSQPKISSVLDRFNIKMVKIQWNAKELKCYVPSMINS